MVFEHSGARADHDFDEKNAPVLISKETSSCQIKQSRRLISPAMIAANFLFILPLR